ncbi:MAG: hypothetical protein M3O46_18320 [Myxococcota bacterium]|nr:hypothetical protein [Myxococcota bacterium]
MTTRPTTSRLLGGIEAGRMDAKRIGTGSGFTAFGSFMVFSRFDSRTRQFSEDKIYLAAQVDARAGTCKHVCTHANTG